MRFWSGLFVALCLLSQPVRAGTILAADSPQTTGTGATFTAPMGWSLESRPGVIVNVAPEADVRLAVVDVRKADTADEAAKLAWSAYRPDFARPVKVSGARAPRNGWDVRGVIDYEVSPSEKLVFQAYALRAGDSWTVLLLEGAEATMDKRGAAIDLVYLSVRPAGFTRETFAGRKANRLDAVRIAQIEDFLRASMDALKIPGVGLALIQDGRVVYEGGLGVKRIGSPEPVDAHTLFMVASNTKGMTTLMMSTLVDEGRLNWDQPVTQVYPAFRLGDDATTARVRIRDLVCACTGLPRKDMEWIFNTPRDTRPKQVFPLLAATQPSTGFGEVFQYNNLITTAGGFISGQVAHPGQEVGAAYDAAMKERVFAPLGMNDTTFSFDTALAGNHASPHDLDPDGQAVTGHNDTAWSIVPYRPAGGAWSSAHDMARYAALELTKGILPDGRRLVSEANLLERRNHRVSTGENRWYGMGLFDDQTDGVSVVTHGGSMPGYMTNFYVLPDAGIAAVVLTNSDTGNSLLAPFMRRLLEVVYDGKPEAEARVASAAKADQEARAAARKRLDLVPATADLAQLAGTYESPELGRIRVEKSASGVKFYFTDWSSPMAARHNDDGTLAFITLEPGVQGVPFVVDNSGGQHRLKIHDSQHDYVFVASKP